MSRSRTSVARASIPAALAVSFILALPSVADAKIAAIRLEDLVAHTPLIATVRVDTVVDLRRGQFAAATVLDVLKGPPLKLVWILAAPRGLDDASMVIPGETALVFLAVYPAPAPADLPPVPKGGIVFGIAQFGRGRMPLREVGGKRYVDFWATDVLVRAEVPTIPAPVTGAVPREISPTVTDRLFRSAELTAIEAEIRRIIRASASPPVHRRKLGTPADR